MSIKNIIIRRSEAKSIEQHPGWILVYGRRKTGKTFMLRNFISWDIYITVSRGLNVIINRKNGEIKVISLRKVPSIVENSLKNDKTIVIDEFQRLPEYFWDILSSYHPRGKLILAGSSLSIVNKVFSKRSPLLGLLLPIKIDLIKPSDAINSLIALGLNAREAIEWSVIIRDPWIIPHINLEKPIQSEIIRLLPLIIDTSISLIGEIFRDEERLLTKTYEAILYSIATGSWKLEEVARDLYQKGIIDQPRLEYASAYIDRLSKMGLIEKIPLYKSRTRVYLKLRSHIMNIAIKIGEKTGITEYTSRIPTNLVEAVKSAYGIELQFFIGEALAEIKNLLRAYTILPKEEGDIDIVLLDKKKKAIMAVEVKSSPPRKIDIINIKERGEKIGARETAVFTLTELKKEEIMGTHIITPRKLIDMLSLNKHDITPVN